MTDSITKNELKPCKCGKAPYLISRYTNGTHYYSYWCPDCDTEKVYELTKKSAERVWNEVIVGER